MNVFSFVLVFSLALTACRNTYIRTVGVNQESSTSAESLAPTGQKISASWYLTCAIVNTAGEVYCWGANFNREIGDNTVINRSTPVKVLGISGATSVVAAQTHACAIVSGDVYCWGNRTIYNTLGDNGPAVNPSYSGPSAVQVVGLPAGGVTSLAASASGPHTCALANGAAYCWGWEKYGQMGNGTGDGTNATNIGSPVVQVTGLSSGVTAIAAGDKHVCAVHNGAVKCWGLNCWSMGGAADCGGANAFGQLGDNLASAPFSTTPVQVQGLTSGATAVALGQFSSCAVVNGGVQCWGRNVNGQLGDGTNTSSAVPVQVSGLPPGSGVTAIAGGLLGYCALVNGAVKCWGSNTYGELGNGISGVASSVPVDVVGLASNVSYIARGAIHSCAIQSDVLKCWGNNSIYGNVGDGSGVQQNNPVSVLQTW
jgi:alpha-tubulin suppressor-like RCC1 family protein